MPDPLPWPELLRRRNGLTPELAAELADATAQQPDHIRYALAPLADLIAAERCPHTDLPTTMCHHCKET